MTQPRIVVLVDLTTHVCEPWAEVGGQEITNLEQVERRGVHSCLQNKRDKEHAILTHVELTKHAANVEAAD